MGIVVFFGGVMGEKEDVVVCGKLMVAEAGCWSVGIGGRQSLEWTFENNTK